ncbi:MAG TPA: TlpA disulfide reductase family protein [Thermoanaerobaculia bacterium]|nr:TlpA disulfide reductase family protein [Thermoanaerobaculia bacterium]
MKKILIVTMTLALAAGCRRAEQKNAKPKAASAPTAVAATGTEVGAVMPEYSSLWLDGSAFELAKYRQNKVVLLNVWATWCGPCRFEIPELQAVHEKYKPKGFEVVGVSVDETGADGVKQFVAENKIAYPIALDAEGKLAALLETSVLPTTVVLDRQGKIVWKKFGAIMPNDPELIKAIESSL